MFSAPDLRAGLRDGLTIGAGYLPLGAGFGILLAASGLEWFWAPITAFLVYAGSLEYLAIGLILGGASLATTAATTFFVNFRHLFYGLSFPLDLVKNRAAKIYAVHALTDEAYAIISTRKRSELTSRRIILTQVLCHLFWVVGAATGALSASLMTFTSQSQQVLSFLLTSLFAVLAVDALRANKNFIPALLALVFALTAGYFSVEGMLVISLSAYALAVGLFAFYRVAAQKPGGNNAS